MRVLCTALFCAALSAVTGCKSVPDSDPEIPERDTFFELMSDGRYDEADRLLSRLEQEYPADRNIRKDRAVYVFVTGDGKTAVPLFTGLIADYPDWPSPYYWRAKCYGSEGKFNEALLDADTLIRLEEELKTPDGSSYELRGMILLDIGEIHAARDDLVKALELDNQQPDAYWGLGVVTIMGSGDIDGGIDCLNKGLALAPDDFMLHRSLAIAYGEKRDWPSAISYWTKCVEMYPDDPMLYYDRAMVYFNVDYKLAAEDLTRAIELAPDFARAYWTRGLIRKIFMRDSVSAQSDYDKAAELDPQLVHEPYPDW